MWEHGGVHVIPAPGKLRQEDCKFQTSRGYIARPVSKKKKERKKGKREEGKKLLFTKYT